MFNYFIQICKSEKLALKTDSLDLVDINGECKGLRSSKMKNAYASKVLAAKAVYILVSVKENDNKSIPVITPILKNSELLTPAFLKNLN